MPVKVVPAVLEGVIEAPPSKSFAHRYLILASLKNGRTLLENVGESDDVKATVASLNALGARITLQNGNATVEGIPFCGNVGFDIINCNNTSGEYIDLPVNESGSTYRFLIVLSAVLGKSVRFLTKGKLSERPNDALLTLLRAHGIAFDEESKTQSGILLGDIFEIDGSMSSQYITAFMLSLPFLKRKTELVIKGNAVSKDYILITEECLKEAKIRFEKTDRGYIFFGSDEYSLPSLLKIEGDWSASSFFLASSFLSNGKVGVKGLNLSSVQGDRAVLEVFKNIGADVVIKNDTVFISKQISLKPVEVDGENIIDSIPILSAVTAFTNGISRFRNVERLVIKESNRLSAILEFLKSAKIKAEYKNGVLQVYGGYPKCGVFNGYKDHRIVMSEAILASFASGGYSLISDKMAVAKSYPSFWSDFQKLGGRISDV